MSADSQRFRCNEPASDETLKALIAATEHRPLPSAYLAFLGRANGGEGFVEEAYVALWRAEDLLQRNLGYQTWKFAPQLFIIGSGGGGEAYAFDQSLTGSRVFLVPFVGLAYDDALRVSNDFDSFIRSAFA